MSEENAVLGHMAVDQLPPILFERLGKKLVALLDVVPQLPLLHVPAVLCSMLHYIRELRASESDLEYLLNSLFHNRLGRLHWPSPSQKAILRTNHAILHSG